MDSSWKRCPYCAEEILSAAVKCKHCGSDIMIGAYRPSTSRYNTNEPLSVSRFVPALIIVMLVLAVASYALSPFYAVYRFVEAARAADRDLLDDAVDFRAVRQNLTSQISAGIMGQMQNDRDLQDNPFAEAGALLAPAIIDKMIDSLVTPESISEMLHRGRPLHDDTGWSQRSTLQIPHKFTYVTLNRFRVDVYNNNRQSGHLGLIFERRALIWWKLIRIDFPPGTFSTP